MKDLAVSDRATKNKSCARRKTKRVSSHMYLEGSTQAEVHQLHLRVVCHGFEANVLKLNIPMLWAGRREQRWEEGEGRTGRGGKGLGGRWWGWWGERKQNKNRDKTQEATKKARNQRARVLSQNWLANAFVRPPHATLHTPQKTSHSVFLLLLL